LRRFELPPSAYLQNNRLEFSAKTDGTGLLFSS
jgi:hypothetical protein